MPRTMEDVKNEHLHRYETDLMLGWYEKLLDPTGNLMRTDVLDERKKALESYLVDIPCVYFELLDNVFLADKDKRKSPSEYLNVNETVANGINDQVEAIRKGDSSKLRQFLEDLIDSKYEVKDVDRAMAYSFEKEFESGVEEIPYDKVKADYLKQKREDDEKFAEHVQELRETDPEKAAYLESESAIWAKENKKLEENALALFDAKYQREILQQKQALEPDAFTKKDQKALEKATKRTTALEKKDNKLRNDMKKKYQKHLKKTKDPYPDVSQNRLDQLSSGDFHYMNKIETLEMSEPVEASNPNRQQVDLSENLPTARQTPNQQSRIRDSQPQIGQQAQEKNAPTPNLT